MRCIVQKKINCYDLCKSQKKKASKICNHFLMRGHNVHFYNCDRPLDLVPVVYGLIELIIKVSLWTKNYSTFDTHTQHTRLLFNECLFHLCDCTYSNVMCVCSTICGSNQKDFCFFCLFLEVICITHDFQSFSNCFCVKNMFFEYFRDFFMCKFCHKLKDPIFKFFSFGQKVSRLFRE